jgi:phosphate:Na+ symporter
MGREVPRQIANAHTIFNIANTLVFIWFDVWFAKLVCKLVREKPVPLPEAAKPLYLDPNFLQTPALAVDRVALEAGHVGDLVLGQPQGVFLGG